MSHSTTRFGGFIGMACCVFLGLFSQLFFYAVFQGRLTAIMAFSEAGRQLLTSQPSLYYQFYPKSKGLLSPADYQSLASSVNDEASMPDAHWFLLSSKTPLLSSEAQRLSLDLFLDDPLSTPGSAALILLCYSVLLCCFFLLCPAYLFLPQDYSAHLSVLNHEQQPLLSMIKYRMTEMAKAELTSLIVSLLAYLAMVSWLNNAVTTTPWLTNHIGAIWAVFCIHLLHFAIAAIAVPIYRARFQTR